MVFSLDGRGHKRPLAITIRYLSDCLAAGRPLHHRSGSPIYPSKMGRIGKTETKSSMTSKDKKEGGLTQTQAPQTREDST